MPLNSQFFAPLDVRLGIAVPPLAAQVAEQGFVLTNADLWEDRHRAWNLLRIGGYLTDAESQRIAYRLIKGVSQAAGYEDAIGDVLAQITDDIDPAVAPPDDPADTEPSPDASAAPPSALDDYLRSATPTP